MSQQQIIKLIFMVAIFALAAIVFLGNTKRDRAVAIATVPRLFALLIVGIAIYSISPALLPAVLVGVGKLFSYLK